MRLVRFGRESPPNGPLSRGVYRLDTNSCSNREQECIYCLRVSFPARRFHVEVARSSRFGVACFKWSHGVAEFGCGECPDCFRAQQLIPCNLGEWSRSDSADTTPWWWSRKGEWSGSNSADSACWWRSLRANGPGPIPPILPPGPGH